MKLFILIIRQSWSGLNGRLYNTLNLKLQAMINPKNKLWWWGPIDGRPIYPDAWYLGLTSNKLLMPPGWPESYSLYKGERYSYICDRADLDRRSTAAFKKYIMQGKEFSKWQKIWRKVSQQFVSINKTVLSKDLALLSDKGLYILISNWYQHYARKFWGVGLLPELSNLGGEVLLQQSVKRDLGLKNNYMTIIEKLSAPEKLSFYQQEECELLRLRQIKKRPLLSKKLLAHQKKYYWLLNSYHNSRVLPLNYFKKRLLSKTEVEAKTKLRQIDSQIQQARYMKILLVKKNRLSSKTVKISQGLSYGIWWQDRRKAHIFQANHTIDVFLRELARRHKVNFADLHWYSFGEILHLTQKSKTITHSDIVPRKKYFVVNWRPHRPTRYLFGDTAKRVYKRFSATISSHSATELQGLAVSPGMVRGKVRVIFSAKQVEEIKRGEILVTTMTSPEFIVAMRKAAGIITDVGGLTSHAAIVSRELKIPCIVGTKIATKVLKTGDKVEIDANKGIIKLVK